MKWTAQARPADAASTLLAQEVRRAGYYPELVLGTLDVAVAGEEVVVDLVQAETTFDDAVHRHLTVLALTPSRRRAADRSDDRDLLGCRAPTGP